MLMNLKMKTWKRNTGHFTKIIPCYKSTNATNVIKSLQKDAQYMYIEMNMDIQFCLWYFTHNKNLLYWKSLIHLLLQMSKTNQTVELETNFGTFVLHNGCVFKEKNHGSNHSGRGQRDLYICRIRDMTIVHLVTQYFYKFIFLYVPILCSCISLHHLFSCFYQGYSNGRKAKQPPWFH